MARYLAMHTGAYPPRDDPEGPAIRRSSLREAHLDGRRVTPTSIHMREGAARGEPIVTEWDDHYAYGIAVHQSCEFEDFTVHNGGLPGWSSAMGFLPRHGVAVVALTNQGRKGRDPTGLVERVLLTLAKTGGLAPRVAVPTASRAVEAAMSRLAAIYDRWSPTAYHAMLSSHRGPVTEEEERQELAGYKELHGACGAFTAVEVKGPLEARFGARCERGVLEMSVVVDPDGLVTGFVGTSRGVRPSAEVGLAAERLASLVARWEDAVFDAVIPDGGAPRAEHAAAFAKLRAAHGTCIVASYDKLPEAHRFALSCKRGPALQLDLKLRREDRTIASYAFHEAQPGGPCPVRP
jgi:hypothetical protein